MTPTLRPTPKQHKAWTFLLDAVTKYIFFGGGAGGGKSWLGCEWLLTNCYKYPGSKWFVGREELKRLMSSTYVTWLKVCKHHGIPRTDWNLNGQYNYIEFNNGSRIDLLDLKFLPSDPLYERFGSLEYTGGWIEEGGEVNFQAFDVLKSRVGRHENVTYGLIGKILVTCNPKKNWLYHTVYQPFKQNILPAAYAFVQSLYTDNYHTAATYGKDLAEIKDATTKERLMYGNWEYDDDPSALIKYDAIVDLFTNTLSSSSTQRFLTVDVARFGVDKTVIRLWEGLCNIRTYVYQKQGTDVTREKVRTIAAEERVPYSQIVIDEDGVGGGVVDGLQGVKGFVANSSAIEVQRTNDMINASDHRPNYRNLKAQCSYMLADVINNHRMAVRSEVLSDIPGVTSETVRQFLTDELGQIKAKDPDDDQKKLQVEGKEKVKELLGRSPDHADTLMMRMFFELRPVYADDYEDEIAMYAKQSFT